MNSAIIIYQNPNRQAISVMTFVKIMMRKHANGDPKPPLPIIAGTRNSS